MKKIDSTTFKFNTENMKNTGQKNTIKGNDHYIFL